MKLKQSATWLPALRRHWALPVLMIPGALACMPAQADEGDVLRPYVGVAVSYDDNVLGATDDAIAAGTAQKQSDTTRRVDAGLLIDKTLGRQRLTANLNVNRTYFSRFSNLDFTGRDLQANWNWRIGNQFDGNIGASDSRALTPFQDFHLPQLNMRTQRRVFVDGGWLFHPSWRLRGALSRYELDYELASQQPNNRRIDEGTVGMDYLVPSGSSVGLQATHSRGDFPNLQAVGGGVVIDNNYNQDELKAKVDWKYSGKTDLQFIGGWVRRSYSTATERDFSGFNARAVANWRVTGKTTLNANAWREIGSVDDLTAAYSLNHGISLGALWEITYKLKLDALLSHESRDYSVSATGPASPYFGRKDTYDNASLRLTWQATRNLRVQLSAYRTLLDSNIGFVAYRNRGLMLNTRLEF